MKRKKIIIQTKHILWGLTGFCLISILLTVGGRTNNTAIENGLGYMVVPMQRGLSNLGIWLRDTVKFVKNINDLEDENRSLIDRLNQLEYDNKTLQLDKIELDRLRQLYELDQKYPSYPKVAARVVAKDPGNWYNTFVIDKGTKHGLQVDMNVLAGNGLVGRITAVGATSATVVSIIDDTSNVSAMFSRTSDLCFVVGDKMLLKDNLLRVEDIDYEAKVMEGEEIVTSHISDKYLQGILIGYMKDIKSDTGHLTKSAYLEPVVDFKHLEEVLVITEVKKVEE